MSYRVALRRGRLDVKGEESRLNSLAKLFGLLGPDLLKEVARFCELPQLEIAYGVFMMDDSFTTWRRGCLRGLSPGCDRLHSEAREEALLEVKGPTPLERAHLNPVSH